MLLTGNIQIAGHNQSPTGIFAVTCTRPYLMVPPALLLIRPDFTGCTIALEDLLVMVTQLSRRSEVQVPSAVRLITVLLSMRVASCSVGMITSLPFCTKTFSLVFVVSSNSPFLYEVRSRLCKRIIKSYPNPPTSTSFVQIAGFSPEEKSSLKTGQYLWCTTEWRPS